MIQPCPHGCQHTTSAVPLIDPKKHLTLVLVWNQSSSTWAAVIAQHDGKVTYADADKVEVRREDGSLDIHIQKIPSFKLGYCLATNARLLKLGISLKKGDFIADGPSMEKGEMALGQTQSLPT